MTVIRHCRATLRGSRAIARVNRMPKRMEISDRAMAWHGTVPLSEAIRKLKDSIDLLGIGHRNVSDSQPAVTEKVLRESPIAELG